MTRGPILHRAPYDLAEEAMLRAGITMHELAHECDDTDPACQCTDEDREFGEEKHAPGDHRCHNRHLHTPCSHDIELMHEHGIDPTAFKGE